MLEYGKITLMHGEGEVEIDLPFHITKVVLKVTERPIHHCGGGEYEESIIAWSTHKRRLIIGADVRGDYVEIHWEAEGYE